MLKKNLVFCLLIVSLSTNAQVGYNRCEVMRSEDARYFEHWLTSKKNILAAQREGNEVYKIPVVVHLLHTGEPIGEGYNFSKERVIAQIRTLTEDYGRKENTPGFNTNPNSGDARIEFILAEIDPDGNPTDGIVRVDMKSVHLPPSTGDIIQTCSKYSYWNPDQYLNVWSMDLGFHPAILLGRGRFPVTDLPGIPQDEGADGVLINASNFGDGETNSEPNYNLGRTLTHEIGHFLGLLHTWGESCATYTDYCEDTPPTETATNGCPSVSPVSCDGRPVMIENYMDYSYDRCMNTFTLDQIARMHTVLENSPRRKSLLTSPALNVVTEVSNEIAQAINVYPNPASDKVYISMNKKLLGQDMTIAAHTLLGKMLLKETFTVTENVIEMQVTGMHEKVIILTIKAALTSSRQLIVIN